MIEILECTLRDASYPIAYQFTAEDTALIAAGLYQSGFTRIEIGHGLGLRASGIKYGFAAATDEQYLSAASCVLPQRIFGVFAIPGIAELDDVDLVAKFGGGFIRVGTDVNRTELAESFIKRGKDQGLEVSSNLMKTYMASPTEVVERSLQLQEWGADIVAVVDSAGGMLPESLREYISSLIEAGVKKVGFHGHNNLQLAVANTLTAIEAGATVVDSTLRGLGRSSGNAQTEALVMCLHRLGYKTGIDIFQTMDISEKIIAPLARGRGSDNIEVASGYSLFHSGFLPLVEKIARTKNIDVRKLIIAVGDGGGRSIDASTVSDLADSLTSDQAAESKVDSVKQAIASFQKTFYTEKLSEDNFSSLVAEMNSLSKKSGKISVLTITKSMRNENGKTFIPFIRVTNNTIIGNVELGNEDALKQMIDEVDELVDFILIDESLGVEISDLPTKVSQVLYYSEANAQVNAVEAYLGNLNAKKRGMKYVVSGINQVSLSFAERLVQKNISVALHDDSPETLEAAIKLLEQKKEFMGSSVFGKVSRMREDQAFDGVIGFKKCNSGFETLISKVKENGFIIDAYIGSFSEDFITLARSRSLGVYRLDMRAGLASEVSLRLETNNLIKNVFGKVIIDDVPVVAGGVVGELGMVVLDSLSKPSKILGIANGRGRLLSNKDEYPYSSSIERVRSHLLLNRLPY